MGFQPSRSPTLFKRILEDYFRDRRIQYTGYSTRLGEDTKIVSKFTRRRPCCRRPRDTSLRVSEARVEVGTTIKYLGIHLDPKLRFNEHFARLAPPDSPSGQFPGPAIAEPRGPKQKARRLCVNVVHAVALYGAPFCAGVAAEAGAQSKFAQLRAAQRTIALRVICGFRDVATETASVLAGVPPLALLAKMYATRYARRVESLQEDLAENTSREALANLERQARQQLLLDWEQHLDEPRATVQEVVAVV
ncbi:uncharacterized protein LOC109861781 [Pseudomyrmex gracilis]|uniref:uncharacterized protein LOC109861781 n=1 Tax=Pseudomyrmex gracilis TaxID=219809 RepID=UPI000995CE30|nr:uncharacterized protein LOC109861781 [Pseudomyrmex gracilis]